MKSLIHTALFALLFLLGAPLASAKAGDCCGARKAGTQAQEAAMASRHALARKAAKSARAQKTCGCYRGCTCAMCTCMKGPGHPPRRSPEKAAVAPQVPRVPDPILCSALLLVAPPETQSSPPRRVLALPSQGLYRRREGLLRGMLILPLRR